MENIYLKANTKQEIKMYEKMFRTLFDKYKNDIEIHNTKSEIYKKFLKDMTEEYISSTTIARKVIDFIAGMTDDYMKKCYNNCSN